MLLGRSRNKQLAVRFPVPAAEQFRRRFVWHVWQTYSLNSRTATRTHSAPPRRSRTLTHLRITLKVPVPGPSSSASFPIVSSLKCVNRNINGASSTGFTVQLSEKEQELQQSVFPFLRGRPLCCGLERICSHSLLCQCQSCRRKNT